MEIICKFCKAGETTHKNLALDFYLCDECDSTMCHNDMWTSTKTGKDYCFYCKYNLEYVGRLR